VIFRVVPRRDRALWAILKVHPQVVVHTGGVAWRAHEEPSLCVYVREGAYVLRSVDGRAIGLAGAGDLVGLGGGGAASPFLAAELVALREGRILPVPAGRVDGALSRGSSTLGEVLRSMEAATGLARSLSGGAGRAPASIRLARVVRESAVRIGESAPAGQGTRIEGVSHRILAEWAGLHRSTVTTILNEWIYDGTLMQRGRGLLVPPFGRLPGEDAAP
jgi:CRP-like cAMP-binding protein